MSDYKYKCNECKAEFENSEYNFTGVNMKCPACGSTNIRLFSLPDNVQGLLSQLRLYGG